MFFGKKRKLQILLYRTEMRNTIVLILIVIYVVTQCGCSRHSAGFSVKRGPDGGFDTATYDLYFTEGVKQKLLGNSSEAIKLLEQCVIMNPKSDAAYYQIAQILLSGGDISNGKKFALNAYNADEKNIWYLSLLAGIYYSEKNLDSSIIYYEKIVKFYPDHDEVFLTLGNIYSEKGDNKKAEETYSYLESKYGVNEDITMSQVKNLVNAGDFNGAEEKLKKLIAESPDEILYKGILAEIYRSQGKNDKAIEIYSKLISMDPSDPQTQMSIGDFLLETNNYNELFTVLNTISLNDKIPKEEKIALIAKCLENDTLVSSRGNDLELVVRVMEATYKGDIIVNLLRPEYYQKAGKTDLAIKRLEELIIEAPENYYAWEKLLILYSETGEYDKLFVRGEECAARFNRSYLAKILYASAATEKGQYDVALEEIRKAKILAGEQKELLIQALTMEADVYYRKKEYSRSFSVFRDALKLDPSDLTVLNNYAYFLAEQGQDLEEAENMINIVIKKEGENKTFLDTYAWVLYKRGKLKEAARVMEEIMKDGGEDADWFEHYGFIMRGMKKCDKAIEYWKRAISLDDKRQYLIKEIENCTKKD
jgi:Tfp pilus assembly protein PilF